MHWIVSCFFLKATHPIELCAVLIRRRGGRVVGGRPPSTPTRGVFYYRGGGCFVFLYVFGLFAWICGVVLLLRCDGIGLGEMLSSVVGKRGYLGCFQSDSMNCVNCWISSIAGFVFRNVNSGCDAYCPSVSIQSL